MKQNYYSFGIPNEAIWLSHILMGLFFVYIGYELVMHKKIPEYLALVIVVLGATGGLYHLHLWYESLDTGNKGTGNKGASSNKGSIA